MTEPNGSFEVACDESGSEGEKLVGGNTDVFAHAGIRLTTALAARCVEETRARAPSPTVEYKSDVIRRAKHRAALVWLLGPSGPLHGNAHVYLIDKTFLVVTRLAGLLPEADPHVVHRQGRRALGDARWTAFLAAFNDLLRAGPVGIRNGRGPRPSAEAVFHLVDGLPYLRRAMPGAAALRAQLRTDPGALPALDPLVPAILQAAAHWGASVPVSLVHDRQTLLTDDRVARLRAAAGTTLAGLRLVDSRTDPRVQVADLLAGAARKIAEDALHGHGDPELTALLRPYVHPRSIWGPGGGLIDRR
ncbi:hypothetical protein HNP84_007702 [Thermocatellispora tengchongensis]|uniref:DUF3800 domain-containing protein n=1 Tax=Thermocatellispora tengchongensis TaxID=1073253 RepID=A0A840PG30_9ACTN|nr:hypothetical protein [Thermocatellispora tengchongensis]MBB5137949.1 hypothetical protein [Thermocatellispora tengchongensis]